jgi:choline dehydrogenase-like flavoprotein
VVDANLRSHDNANLLSTVLQTSGTANPTLTIAALALRAVATIIG